MSRLALLILILPVLLCNCSKKKTIGAILDTTIEEADTIAYTIATVELKSRDCRNEDSACAVARYSFPEIRSTDSLPLKDSLERIWTQLFGPCSSPMGPEACAVEFVKGYEETVHEAHQDGMDYTVPWYSSVSATVFQWRGMFGILAVSDEFGGGAHPNTTVSTFHLDSRTGRRLQYSDIYTDTLALAKRMEQGFYHKHGLTQGKPIGQDVRFFPNARLAMPSVWIPEGDSLYLFWNTYELGPRTSGDFELKVEVKDLYKKPVI